MISEELELCVKGEQVSYRWSMTVVSQGYGGGRGGGWSACGTKSGGWSHVGALPECEVIH